VFEPLPIATVENVARRLAEVRASAGEVVVREGDPGDRFYVVAEGWTDVSCGERTVAERGPGEFFGEIALLRDVPRTATVTARGDVLLYALERDSFLSALGAHPRSDDAVRRIADSRLATVVGDPVPARSPK
jgi:CRP-like cAMP-binding protein